MLATFQRLAKNPFLQGGVIFTVMNFVSGFINYLFNAAAAKLLGPRLFSEIIALSAYLTIFVVPIFIVNAEILKKIGLREKNKLVAVLSWERWMWQKIWSWKFLLIPYLALTFVMVPITNLSILSSFALVSLFLLITITAFYLAALQGLHRFYLYSVLLLSIALIKLAGPIAVFFGIGKIETIIIFLILSEALPIIIGNWLLHRIKHKNKFNIYQVQKRVAQVLFERSMIITAVSLVSITFLINLDVMMAKKLLEGKEAGIYGAWNLCAKVVFYVLLPVLSYGFIFFSNRAHKSRHTPGLLFVSILVLAAGAFAAVFYHFFGKLIIIILFSPSFNPLLPLLFKSAIFGTLYTYMYGLNNFLLARNSRAALTSLVLAILFGVSLSISGQDINTIINTALFFASAGAIIYTIFTIFHLYKYRMPTSDI